MLRKILAELFYPLAVVGVVLGVWALAAQKAGSQFIMPTLSKTFADMGKALSDKQFYTAFAGTLKRTFYSFFISIVSALILALLAKQFSPVKKLLVPAVAVTRAIPTMSIVLLLVLWTNAQIAPMIVSQLVVLPTLYTQFSGALDGLDPRITQMARVYKVPRGRLILKYYIPFLMPVFILSAGAGLSLNLKLMVAAEVLAQTSQSIGNMMFIAKAYFETGTLMALTVITVVMGLVFEYSSKLFSPLWRWRR